MIPISKKPVISAGGKNESGYNEKKNKTYFRQTSEIRSDIAMTAEAFMWQLSLCALWPEIAVG